MIAALALAVGVAIGLVVLAGPLILGAIALLFVLIPAWLSRLWRWLPIAKPWESVTESMARETMAMLVTVAIAAGVVLIVQIGILNLNRDQAKDCVRNNISAHESVYGRVKTQQDLKTDKLLQERIAACETKDDWVETFEPFRFAGIILGMVMFVAACVIATVRYVRH